MGSGGRERRRLKRIVKRIPIRFDAGGLRGQGHIKNLSKEGLFIRSHLLPQPGEAVRITFDTPDGRKVEIEASVRWTTAQLADSGSPPGFGVYIESPGPEWREFYAALLFR